MFHVFNFDKQKLISVLLKLAIYTILFIFEFIKWFFYFVFRGKKSSFQELRRCIFFQSFFLSSLSLKLSLSLSHPLSLFLPSETPDQRPNLSSTLAPNSPQKAFFGNGKLLGWWIFTMFFPVFVTHLEDYVTLIRG